MSHTRVRDVMTTDVRTVRPEASFHEVLDVVARCPAGGVPVTDSYQRVAGMVAEADLLKKIAYGADSAGRRLETWPRHWAKVPSAATTAGRLMTSPAITLGPEATVVDAARLMDRHRLKRLPVVDRDGRLLGMVSRADLVRVFSRDEQAIGWEIKAGLAKLPWTDFGSLDVTVDHGVATLSGRLGLRSQCAQALNIAREVDGVVEVVDRFDCEADNGLEWPAPSIGVAAAPAPRPDAATVAPPGPRLPVAV